MRSIFLRTGKPLCQGYCMIAFLVVLAPKFIWLGLLRSYSPFLSYMATLLMGWFTWTFVEYILHRFWMHGGHRRKASENDAFNHHHHHTHPTEIRVTSKQRVTGIALVVLVLGLSTVLGEWFTVVAGFVIGFVAFINMHWVLHQEWAKRFIPKLQEQHIHHHLKFPNHACGITTRLWDRMFGTTAPHGALISAKVYRFYIDGKVTRSEKN